MLNSFEALKGEIERRAEEALNHVALTEEEMAKHNVPQDIVKLGTAYGMGIAVGVHWMLKGAEGASKLLTQLQAEIDAQNSRQ